MIGRWVVLLCTWLIGATCSVAQIQTVEITPQGEFAKIDTTRAIETIDAIHRGDKGAIAQVQEDPGSYQPPVLYALAAELFQRGRKDDAMYWFYLGQLRARSDANKALDPSAAGGVDVLNQSVGAPINTHAFQSIPKLVQTVEKVASDDASLPRNYDPRWIALHGADAFTETKLRFAPESRWTSINDETRRGYLSDFRAVIDSLQQ